MILDYQKKRSVSITDGYIVQSKHRATADTDVPLGGNVKSTRIIGRLETMNPYLQQHKSLKLHQRGYMWFYYNGIKSYLKGDPVFGHGAFFGTLALAYADINSGRSGTRFIKFDKAVARADKKKLKKTRAEWNAIKESRDYKYFRHGIRVVKNTQERKFVVDTPFMLLNGQSINLLTQYLVKASPIDEAMGAQPSMASLYKETAMPDDDFNDIQDIDSEEIEKLATQVDEEDAKKAKVKKVKTENSEEEVTEEVENIVRDIVNVTGADMEFVPKPIPWSHFVSHPSIGINCDSRLLHKFGECVTHVVAHKLGSKTGTYILCLRAEVTAEEAEFLTSSPFDSTRALDLYALVEAHTKTCFGTRSGFGKSPKFLVPLPKIHAETPAGDNDYRGNGENIGVNPEGILYYLPKGINKINQTEGALSRSLIRDDGSFQVSIEDTDKSMMEPLKTPQDIVYTDWTNLKLVYVNASHQIDSLAVDRVTPATMTHYARVMKSSIEESTWLKSTLIYAMTLAVQFGKLPSNFEYQTISSQIYNLNPVGTPSTYSLKNFFERKKEFPIMQELFDALGATLQVLRSDIGTAFSRYSVITTLRVIGLLTAIQSYAVDVAASDYADETLREVYLNNALDPTYKSEAVPYVSSNLKFMPHQVKVNNATRNDPPFTILGVDAGGGKTLLAVYQVLKMLQNGVHPILIICPSHLVHQYQEELVSMTEGRINSVPITAYTWRRIGAPSLSKMILGSPLNTVVISDYNILRKQFDAGYGIKAEKIYPIVDFLRQFNFEYVVGDESHFLKAENSARNAAAHRLMAQIPRKCIMSGTLVANQVNDLVKQVALLDPTIFGSVQEFENKYAIEKKGNKVVAWKPGYEKEVRQTLEQNACFVQIKRKEWAAILPPRTDEIHPVDLTPDQQRVYNMIVTQSIDELTENAKTNKRLAKLLRKVQGLDIESDDEDDTTVDGDDNVLDEDGDEDPDSSDLFTDNLLNPYIARLESFTSAPGLDILGAVELKGGDLVSPKMRAAADLVLMHISSNIPGKVIVFFNYELSAQAFDAYVQTVPGLSGKGIYYRASDKDASLARFNREDSVKFMYGISASMDTGLNLQRASRLIRCESVWTPGVWEQGNSRIERPDLKSGGKDPRPNIYFDSFVITGTIDVTKTAYLLTKLISAEKFYNAGTPEYDNIKTPDMFTMSLENIFNMSSLVGLAEYYQAYGQMRGVISAEYAAYRKTHGNIVFEDINRSADLEGSKLMLQQPLAPGATLAFSGKLGLQRYDEYMNLNAQELLDGEEKDDGSDVEDATTAAKSAIETAQVKGLKCFVDMGEGEIIRAGKYRLNVRLNTGERVVRSKLAVFVKKKDIGKPIKVAQAELAGLQLDEQPSSAVYVKPTKVRPGQEIVETTGTDVELGFRIFNDFLTIQLLNPSSETVAIVQNYGFTSIRSFYWSRMKNVREMTNLIAMWKAHGFKFDKDTMSILTRTYEHFVKHVDTDFYGVAARSQFKNWMIHDFKSNPDKLAFQPFPLTTEDQLWLCLPKGPAGSDNAIRLSTHPKNGIPAYPGKWRIKKGEDQHVLFTMGKVEAKRAIERMLKDKIRISNIDAVKAEFKDLRVFKRVQS